MKIFIVAGDQSGDNYGAKLMHEIKNLQSNVEFLGIGGKNMVAEGLNSLAKIEDISVVGFWEVAKKYIFFKDLLNKCTKTISKEKVDLFLPIDYPGFNIRLATNCQKFNIPVVYYIAPQLWAWGANRVEKLKNAVDKLIVILPFEKEYFSKFGISTEYFGHPLLDNRILQEDFIPIENRNKIITIMPGSRKQEVKRHLPVIFEIISKLNVLFPDFEFHITKSNLVKEIEFEKLKQISKNVKIVKFDYDSLRKSRFALIKTGTSNIEAALCGLPFAMYYKTSALSYLISKWLINLPYISLINIILNKLIVSEYIQSEANVDNLIGVVNKHLTDVKNSNEMLEQFTLLREQLGNNGATKKIAQYTLNFINSYK